MTPAAVVAGTGTAVVILALDAALVTYGRARRRQIRRAVAGRPLAPVDDLSERFGRFADRLVVPVPNQLRRAVDDLALPITTDRAASLWAGATVLFVVAVGVTSGVTNALLGAVVIVVLSASGVVMGAGRAAKRVERELPMMLDAVAAGLRSGSSVLGALADGRDRSSGPLRVDVDRVVALEAAGVSLPVALRRWREARPTAGVNAAVAALSLALDVGGAAAAAIDGVAASRRDSLAVGDEMRALSTQARASAAVIVLAPVCFAALTGAADHESWEFLTTTPPGLACLLAGVVLDVAGGLWMTRLARVAS